MTWLLIAAVIGILASIGKEPKPMPPTQEDSFRYPRKVLNAYRSWFERYRGGMPVGFLAAICQHESNGQTRLVGDKSLGEYGLFQIAEDVPGQFGYPASARMNAQNNVAIAVLEYSCEAVRWHLDYPEVELGSVTNWWLARLSFAIGRGGSHKLANLARTAGYTGPLYAAILAFVRERGSPQLGSQSPEKVKKRVESVPTIWTIGDAIAPGSSYGPPKLIPLPPAGQYKLPAKLAPYFQGLNVVS